LCKICLDAQQNCVFLDCGHMATCMDCAKTVRMGCVSVFIKTTKSLSLYS
jgi:hypothetical protein